MLFKPTPTGHVSNQIMLQCFFSLAFDCGPWMTNWLKCMSCPSQPLSLLKETKIDGVRLGPASFSADARNSEIPLLCCFQMHMTRLFLSKENFAVLHCTSHTWLCMPNRPTPHELNSWPPPKEIVCIWWGPQTIQNLVVSCMCLPSYFFLQVHIHPGHVISVNHGGSAESAAGEYEFAIRQLVRNQTVGVSRSSDCPRFDLILLVIGGDGRVASLLPGHPVLTEHTEWVAHVSGVPWDSVTLTIPVINSAANVAIMATGSHVARPLAAAITDYCLQDGSHPAQLIAPANGELIWFVDTAAASLICQDEAATS